MTLSTRGRYGLRILLDIALFHTEGEPRGIRKIANSQDLSEKYVSRLIVTLRRGGFVKSVRGTNGGYILSKKPEEITLLDILDVMEEGIHIVECIVPDKESCPRRASCPARQIWQKIDNKIRAVFAEYTLQDLVELYRKNGEGFLDYCI